MFRGLTAVNVDEKGRLAIPRRYRAMLEDAAKGNLIITIDTEQRCLLMYTLAEWERIEAKLTSLPSFNPQARRVQRLLLGHATELEMDKQGRVLLPLLLRDYASIDKAVMLVGQGNKFELWSEESWGKARDAWLDESNQDSLPPELESLSL